MAWSMSTRPALTCSSNCLKSFRVHEHDSLPHVSRHGPSIADWPGQTRAVLSSLEKEAGQEYTKIWISRVSIMNCACSRGIGQADCDSRIDC